MFWQIVSSRLSHLWSGMSYVILIKNNGVMSIKNYFLRKVRPRVMSTKYEENMIHCHRRKSSYFMISYSKGYNAHAYLIRLNHCVLNILYLEPMGWTKNMHFLRSSLLFPVLKYHKMSQKKSRKGSILCRKWMKNTKIIPN